MSTDCAHRHIQAFSFEDGSHANLWGCVDCSLRFAPLASTEAAARAAGLKAGLLEAAKVCEERHRTHASNYQLVWAATAIRSMAEGSAG